MKNDESRIVKKKAIKVKNLAFDALIPLTAFIISTFFFSAEESLLIAISISMISLLIETN